MEKKNTIQFGHFSISFPDETFAVFWIFEDLADFFNTEVQSDAVSILKNELKNVLLKPKPSIDFESGYTFIVSRSAETIFEVAKIICNLTVKEKRQEPSESELENIYNTIKCWKRPPAQKWKIGDIISVPLLDNTFTFGQIVGTHITKRGPILALFNFRKESIDIDNNEIKSMVPIAVYNSDEEEIANYTFKVLYNYEILVSPERSN